MNLFRAEIREGVLYWIVGNLLGWGYAAAFILYMNTVSDRPRPLVGLLLLGLPVGFVQWLALRRSVSVSPLWTLNVIAGVLVWIVLIRVIPEAWLVIGRDESVATLSLGLALLGASLGFPQWLLLRRELPTAWVWILGCAAGMGLGFALVLSTGLMNRHEYVSYFIAGGVYALVTGSILFVLLCRAAFPDRNSQKMAGEAAIP